MDVKRVLLGGLVASMVMGMWEMVLEQFVGGNGFWSPVVYITATVLRDYQNVATPVPFEIVPVVLGLMGHMMNSVILGFAFAKVAPKFTQSTSGLVGLGLVYGIIVMAGMWFVVLPIIDPVMLRLNFVIFLLAHMMWGAGLGLVLGWNTGPQPRLRESHA